MQKPSKNEQGLIIRKKKLLNGQFMLHVFTRAQGKMVLSAFGIKKITSRRLSHLEVGNVLSFSYRHKDQYYTLLETDLMYGHSRVKQNEESLQMMYMIFFVLNKIVPENEPDEMLYDESLKILRKMNKEPLAMKDLEEFLTKIMIHTGFLDDEKLEAPGFDVMKFIESVIGQKMLEM